MDWPTWLAVGAIIFGIIGVKYIDICITNGRRPFKPWVKIPVIARALKWKKRQGLFELAKPEVSSDRASVSYLLGIKIHGFRFKEDKVSRAVNRLAESLGFEMYELYEQSNNSDLLIKLEIMADNHFVPAYTLFQKGGNPKQASEQMQLIADHFGKLKAGVIAELESAQNIHTLHLKQVDEDVNPRKSELDIN